MLSYPKKIRHMLNSSNSQAEYEDLHGIQGEIFMNIQTASNLNSRSSCLKHFDAEETGAQDLWSGAKCWMLGHWGLAILPRERVQPVTNHWNPSGSAQGQEGEIFMNIQTASNLNSRSSCLKHFDAEETGAQDLWSGAKCWMLGHWGLAILPRERVQPVTNHAMEPIWQRSRARGHQSRRQSFKCCRVKSLNVRLCGQKVQASSGTMSKRVKTSLHKQLV